MWAAATRRPSLPFARRRHVASARASAQPPASTTLRTCRHCKRPFDPTLNTPTSCRHHPALFTGGEVSKAIGFLRDGDGSPWLMESVGRAGLLRFWDCCGAGDEDAPGCVVGPHEPFE